MKLYLAIGVLCAAFWAASAGGCSWGQWSDWSDCSNTCGKGMKMRTRYCPEYCKCDYKGTKVEKQTMTCYGYGYGCCTLKYKWKKVGPCRDCKQLYKKKCYYVPKKLCKKKKKPKCKETKVEKCYSKKPYWGPWGPWSKCDVTCGAGKKKRTRKCHRECDYDDYGDCYGHDYETMTCHAGPCCECGPWSQWADYGDCYETKDYPRRCVKKQKRYCNCPSYCPPSCSKIEYRIVDCPDAYWLSWGPWSKCDVTCGVGTKKRVRICKKYCPNQKCPGSAYETMTCSEKPCCECGPWSSWENEGDCYKQDGYPPCVQKQKRTCRCPDYCPYSCHQTEYRKVPCPDKYKYHCEDECECKYVYYGDCYYTKTYPRKCVIKMKCECKPKYCKGGDCVEGHIKEVPCPDYKDCPY